MGSVRGALNRCAIGTLWRSADQRFNGLVRQHGIAVDQVRRFVTVIVAPVLLALLGIGGLPTLQGQLTPFRDPARGLWGYRTAAGSIAIRARFVGAGNFVEGRAPVEDSGGFAIIDQAGRVVERIRADSVRTTGAELAPPPDECAWPRLSDFPSGGLQCYARALRRGSSAVGGALTRRTGGEGASAAIVHRFESGVVMVEEQGYEGFRRRILLPGITPGEAARWRVQLFPDRPPRLGCGEEWSSGAVPGGAFIEQRAGC